MNPCESGDPAIADLVAQLLQTTGTLTLIVNEMLRHAAGHSAPDAPSVVDVATRVLCDVLPPLLDNHPPPAIEAVTTVLRDADEIICRDLYFVPPEAMPATAERRPGTPRARRKRR